MPGINAARQYTIQKRGNPAASPATPAIPKTRVSQKI
jgi:hypothetical protein